MTIGQFFLNQFAIRIGTDHSTENDIHFAQHREYFRCVQRRAARLRIQKDTPKNETEKCHFGHCIPHGLNRTRNFCSIAYVSWASRRTLANFSDVHSPSTSESKSYFFKIWLLLSMEKLKSTKTLPNVTNFGYTRFLRPPNRMSFSPDNIAPRVYVCACARACSRVWTPHALSEAVEKKTINNNKKNRTNENKRTKRTCTAADKRLKIITRIEMCRCRCCYYFGCFVLFRYSVQQPLVSCVFRLYLWPHEYRSLQLSTNSNEC